MTARSAIRHHREGVPLAHRGAAAGAVSDRLADAGHPPRHEARRRHDLPYLRSGSTILVLIVLRFAWRLTHPVAPESSLPPWQRLSSEAVHWALYVLVLATTLSPAGCSHRSAAGALRSSILCRCRCWHPTTPRPARRSTACIRRRNGRLLVCIGIHVAAALAHIFIYRDRIMQRMLPG